MSTIKDPAVTGWRAWKRAESTAAHAPMSRWAAAYAVAEEADELLLHAWPVTSRGAWCLLARAYDARLISEHNASDAPIDEATSAAYLMKRSTQMLWRGEHGALAPLREAIRIMIEPPLPDADNDLPLRHAQVALAFLSRPRGIAI